MRSWLPIAFEVAWVRICHGSLFFPPLPARCHSIAAADRESVMSTRLICSTILVCLAGFDVATAGQVTPLWTERVVAATTEDQHQPASPPPIASVEPGVFD